MSNPSTADSLEREFGGADAEMARRLLALNRAPRPALLVRVRAIPSSASPARTAPRRSSRLAWTLIAAALLLVGLFAATPPLRAALGVVGERIGDLYLSVTDRLPDTSRVEVQDYRWVAPDQVSFDFLVPRYAPQGWTLDPEVGVGHLRGDDTNDVLVRWTGPGQAHIFMSVWPPADGQAANMLIGTDSYQEIEINGRPSAIVKGVWNSDTGEWERVERHSAVVWAIDRVQYVLWCATPDLPDEELIRMAESAR